MRGGEREKGKMRLFFRMEWRSTLPNALHVLSYLFGRKDRVIQKENTRIH
jgi:hypothetical protein